MLKRSRTFWAIRTNVKPMIELSRERKQAANCKQANLHNGLRNSTGLDSFGSMDRWQEVFYTHVLTSSNTTAMPRRSPALENIEHYLADATYVELTSAPQSVEGSSASERKREREREITHYTIVSLKSLNEPLVICATLLWNVHLWQRNITSLKIFEQHTLWPRILVAITLSLLSIT